MKPEIKKIKKLRKCMKYFCKYFTAKIKYKDMSF